jgi:acyl-CoA synthetase (AMP-forming)/AMP-acid ligase II
MLGGVVTTVNPLYTPEELAFQLRDTGATHLVTVAPFLGKAREAARGTRSASGKILRRVLVEQERAARRAG